MEEEDEPLLPREKLLRYDVTLLKMMNCWRSFYVPERPVKRYLRWQKS